jgi:hypothetical protein
MINNTETDENIIETRYRAGAGQETLNIELGLAGDISLSSQSGTSASASPTLSGSSTSTSSVSAITGGTGGSRMACFIGETRIGLSRTKPISEFKELDPVYGFEGKLVRMGQVLHVFEHWVTELLRIEFSNKKALYVRAEHKFFFMGTFAPIGSFGVGDTLWHNHDFSVVTMTDKHLLTFDKPIKVYNLETSLGTYFAEGFPVSNAKLPRGADEEAVF